MGDKPAFPGYQWPEGGLSRVPYWAYSDPEIYKREQERIFCGASWAYVALEAEIPNPGDYKRTFIGDKPVVVTRDEDRAVNVFENRCCLLYTSDAAAKRIV